MQIFEYTKNTDIQISYFHSESGEDICAKLSMDTAYPDYLFMKILFFAV
jgi:hypothetical protein